MEYAKNLEGNIQNLLEKLATLQGLAELMAARGEQPMEEWLRHLKHIQTKADELQKEVEGLRKGGGRRTKKKRQVLNKKVMGYLKDVNDLEEEGKVKAESIEGLLKELQGNQFERFTPSDLEVFTENYSTLIGKGAYGRVYKGHFRDNFPVAVKVLDEKDITSSEATFMAEVRTLGKTSHRNLVKLYGLCFTVGIKALVYEHMEKGSLDNYLYGDNSERIEWGKLYKIAIETARGLLYLHEGLKARIIHRDVKPANVLLDSYFIPKLTDFGVAALMSRDVSHVTLTKEKGTPGFAAPEMWRPGSRVTHKCDVYSFGMMLFEILGRRKNTSSGGKWFPGQVEAMMKNSELNQLLDECGIDQEEDREKAKILCKVALQCTRLKAKSRPTMSSVMRMLEAEFGLAITPGMSPPQTNGDVVHMLNPDPQLRPSISVEEGDSVSTKQEENQQTSNSPEVGAAESMPQRNEQIRWPPGGKNSVINYTTKDPRARAVVLKACEYVHKTLQSYGIEMFEGDGLVDENSKFEVENVVGEASNISPLSPVHFSFKWIEESGEMQILLHGILQATIDE